MKTYITSMKTKIASHRGPHSSAFFTPLLIIAAALAVSAPCHADTEVHMFCNDYLDGFHNIPPVSGSTSLSFSGALGHLTVSASCGSISVSAHSGSDGSGNGSYFSGGGSWSDTITINSSDPSLNGTSGTMRTTYNLRSAVNKPGNDLSYSLSGSGFQFNDNIPVGMVSSQFLPGTFTADVGFTFGTPIQIGAILGLTANASWPLSSSGDWTLSSSGMSVLSGGNTVGYTSSSTMGSGAGSNVSSGGSFAGFTLTNTAPASHGTIVSVLGGTASVATTLNASFLAAPNGVLLASDAVGFSGTISDKFVLQLNYDPTAANALFGGASGLILEWLNPASNTWDNVVLGNSDGGAQQQHILGAYNAGVDFVLGDYGVDTTNHTVWAVIDHKSAFAVGSLSLGSVSTPAPTLTIIPSGANVILTWPTYAPGVTLQSTTNLVSPVLWSSVSPAPVVVNGQNSVTNPISGTKKFYRLSQ